MQSVAELGLFSVDLVLTLLITHLPRHTLESPASGLCRRLLPAQLEQEIPLSAHARASLPVPPPPSPHDPRGQSWSGANETGQSQEVQHSMGSRELEPGLGVRLPFSYPGT